MQIEITANNEDLKNHKIAIKNGEKAIVTHAYSSGVIDIKMIHDGYEIFRIPMHLTNYEKKYLEKIKHKKTLRNK